MELLAGEEFQEPLFMLIFGQNLQAIASCSAHLMVPDILNSPYLLIPEF